MPRQLEPTPSHIPDLRALSRELRRVGNDALFEAGSEYARDERKRFVRKIEAQAFQSFQEIFYPESGTNLSPAWLERKEAHGRDLRTMIATEWYKSNIKVFTRKARRKSEPTTIKVGFDKRTLARDLNEKITDVPLWLVAIYNEYGSLDGRLPARPHWGPHFTTMHMEAPRTRKRIRIHVKKAFLTDKALKGKIVVT